MVMVVDRSMHVKKVMTGQGRYTCLRALQDGITRKSCGLPVRLEGDEGRHPEASVRRYV